MQFYVMDVPNMSSRSVIASPRVSSCNLIYPSTHPPIHLLSIV